VEREARRAALQQGPKEDGGHVFIHACVYVPGNPQYPDPKKHIPLERPHLDKKDLPIMLEAVPYHDDQFGRHSARPAGHQVHPSYLVANPREAVLKLVEAAHFEPGHQSADRVQLR
jgi:hypothetical protein